MCLSRLAWILGKAAAGSVLVVSLALAAASPRERFVYWKENYGELLPSENAQAKRAHEIFRRVRRVAGMRPGVHPRLLIIKRDPLEIALPIAIPDGSIILSQRALELCYRDPRRGDDRLAFMLGHELAHQLKDDFWHFRFFQALAAAQANPPDRAAVTWFRQLWSKARVVPKSTVEDSSLVYAAHELQADEYGMVYATIAGFNTQAIVSADDSVNFFADWLLALDPAHRIELPASSPLTPERRAAVVKRRLRQILAQVDVFHWGVRFYQVGDYSKAILAFQDFQKSFPSPEVYHNLASSYHQLALKQACLQGSSGLENRFQLTLAIDATTRAQMISLLEAQRGPVDDHLEQAIDFYQRAIALDPSYVNAYSNLGGAWVQRGKVYKAIATLQDALENAPDSPEVRNHLGIAFFQAGRPDAAKVHLSQARALAPAYAAPLFNLGMIAHEEGQPAAAKAHWRAYLALDSTSPWTEVIRHPQISASPCGWRDHPPESSEHVLGVQVEAREREMPAAWGHPIETTHLALESEPYQVSRYANGITTVSQMAQILFIETLESFRGQSAQGITIGHRAERLREFYGPPSRISRMMQDESWVYDTRGIAFQLRGGKVVSWLLF